MACKAYCFNFEGDASITSIAQHAEQNVCNDEKMQRITT
jgi:hypothetical protein